MSFQSYFTPANGAAIQYHLAQTSIRNGKPAVAARRLTALLSDSRYGDYAATALCKAYISNLRLDAARTLANDERLTNVARASCMTEVAIALAEQGRPQQSIALVQNAIEADGTNVRAHLVMGLLLSEIDGEQAIEHLRLALTLEPNDHETHATIAALYESAGDMQLATRHRTYARRLREALSID